MKTYKYKVLLQSDSGKFRVTAAATSEEEVKRIVMKVESCPESAILKIENLGEV